MLNHIYRATRKDIAETIKTGTSIFGRFLYIKISKDNAKKCGFAIVVSKKTAKTSVGRHFIKRRISSYLEKKLFKIKPSFKKTIVFFVKKTDQPIDYKEIGKDIESIFEKIVY